MLTKQQVVIYGAGKRGQKLYEFFQYKKWDCYIYGFCDKNHGLIKNLCGKQVCGYDQVKGKHKTFLISVADQEAACEIAGQLKADGEAHLFLNELLDLLGEDAVDFGRDFCAFSHVGADYFEEAEERSSLDVFWNENSDFYLYFKKLDLTNVIELACGRGRHVPEYILNAGNVTLVDILQDNIDYCRNRFQQFDNVEYYCNSGYNLEKLESGRYTALFSYDAMVHFEMMDIYEYLKDIYRVLTDGGRVLLHHSNCTKDYRISYTTGPRNRNYMSKDIFAYLAYRAGFTVKEQRLIDWGGGGQNLIV